MNFKPLFLYLKFRYQAAFKALFKANGLDLFPIFSSQLLFHFCNSTLPHHELVYKASQRAFKNFKPRFAISFLELFPYSRAFYNGARNGSPKTLHGAVQHASYSREKTFILLEPEIEFNGKPDGCPVPKPDYIFAMGELGKEIFMESGFPDEKVLLTGSTRYEDIKSDGIIRDVKKYTKNILMVASINMDLDMEMIEAVYLATLELANINILLRSHPFAKTKKHSKINNFKNRIKLTKGSLEEDLENADLIIFSYSTVAKEALIRGIPVWQWLAVSYNGSAFRDLNVIPSFYSVSDLKESLKEFISDPASFIPSQKTRDFVLKKCFFAADGKSSERIADYLVGNILLA
jgi:surface carbohydrate biosynthesis protein (TIGR04326 family)